MSLENLPVGGAVETPAPKTEMIGDFGYKSSVVPPVENTVVSPVDPPAPEAPTPSTETTPAAPSAPPASAEAQPDNESWFDIPGPTDVTLDAGADTPPVEGSETPAATNLDTAPTDWKEIIKGVSREDLLKELGIEEDDDFERDFKKHRRNGGNPIDYLEAKSKDWTKIDDTSLAMLALSEQNPTLTKEELQLLFEENYFQDEDATDREKELGKIKIKTDADRKRRAEIERQKQFTIPDKPMPAANEEEVVSKYREQYLKEAAETVKADNEKYMSGPVTQEIIKSKKVTVPLGKDGSFSIGVDPAKITGFFTDPSVYESVMFDAEGNPDMQLEHAIAAIRILGLGEYNRLLVSQGKKQAEKGILEEGQNISKPGNATPPGAAKSKPTWISTGGN